MSSARWQRIEALFAELIAQPAEDRLRLLESLVPGDEELRLEVRSLLECDVPDQSLQKVVRSAAAAVFPAQLPKQERLGPYEVIRKLGQGGMGTVYLAVRADDQYHQQVAIKLITLGMESAEAVERFRRERQILASLTHPYIARLMDGGSARIEGLLHETPYFVMEYVEGEPINAYCERQQLDVAGRLQLFLKVCEAVTYAHRNLVVHRDLKPGNILVTPEGSPKLLDFGIAKLLNEGGADTRHTFTGLRLTPDYASPEQVLETQVTTATDVYSLGAILYFLLTGTKPHRFSTYTAQEINHVICEIDPPKFAEAAPHLRGQLHDDLEAIVGMAMRKEPDRRYASVEQLSADINRYLEGWPVDARPNRFPYRAGKYIRRNKTWIAASVVVAVSLIAGTAVATFEAVQASRAQARAEQERERAIISQSQAETSRQEALRQAQEARRQREFVEQERHESELQRAEADAQRGIAERRFDQVHQLAGKFLMDFHDAISRLPGATPARKMVVQTGLAYYDTLVKEAGNNRVLLEEIANGYDRLGDVQGNTAMANLGDPKGALASYRRAFSIREKIADPSPKFQRERIANRVRMSQITMDQLDWKSTEQYLQEALKMCLQSPAAESFLIQTELSRIYGAIGDLRWTQGRPSEAVEPYQKVLEIATRLAPQRPNSLDAEASISFGHTKLGDLLGHLKRIPEAMAHLRLAVETDKRHSDSQPNNMVLKRKLFITYHISSRALSSSLASPYARPGELRHYLEEAFRLAESMAAADPDNLAGKADVIVAASALGDWFLTEKRPEDAVPPLLKAVAEAEFVKTKSGQDSVNQANLILAHRRLGTALTDAGKYEQAWEHFARAREYLNHSESKTPGLINNAVRLAGIIEGESEWYAVQHRWKESAAGFQKLLEIFDSLIKRDPERESFLKERPHFYMRLADCYAGMSQWDSAANAIKGGLERFQEIERRRPLVKAEVVERDEARAKSARWNRMSTAAK